MKNSTKLPIPVIRAVRKLGKDIKDARRRRRIPMWLMAERSGVSRGTIGKIEKGDPTTSMGNYASVLFVLGMIDLINNLADTSYDLKGHQLEDEKLPLRVRLPRK